MTKVNSYHLSNGTVINVGDYVLNGNYLGVWQVLEIDVRYHLNTVYAVGTLKKITQDILTRKFIKWNKKSQTKQSNLEYCTPLYIAIQEYEELLKGLKSL